MGEITTIRLRSKVLTMLKNAMEYPRQTYSELLQKMVHVFAVTKQNNQYDDFLHKIQQSKMKELWDNPSDEGWENV